MAKAIFERSEDSFADKPVTTTPVRDVSRAKKSGPGEFTVKADGGEAKAKVVPGADRTTVYKKLGDNEGYPRGFNPQQMGEVRQAETTGRMSIFSDSAMGNGRRHAEHEKSLVRETLARSRFNPMNLSTAHAQMPGVQTPLGIKVEDPGSADVGGEYFIDDRTLKVHPNYITEPTLIHEIGHDVGEHDEQGNRKRNRLVAPLLRGAKSFIESKGGKLYFDKHYQPEGMEIVPAHTDEAMSHIKKWADTTNGYNEGYANKFQDENYVHDPRSKAPSPEDAYREEALFGEYAPEESRLKHFSAGYRAAGGPVEPHDSPAVTQIYNSAKRHPSPDIAIRRTRLGPDERDFFYTGQSVIDAVEAARASRNSTDSDLRNTNG